MGFGMEIMQNDVRNYTVPENLFFHQIEGYGSLLCMAKSFQNMLSCLRHTAINPCNPVISFERSQKLHLQMLKVRKALSLSNIELHVVQKKRKHHQFLEELADNPEVPKKKSTKEGSRPMLSSESSDETLKISSNLVSPPRFGENLSRKRVPNVLPFQTEVIVLSSSSEEPSHDIDDSVSSPSSSNFDTPVQQPTISVTCVKPSPINKLPALLDSHPSDASFLRKPRQHHASQCVDLFCDKFPRHTIPVGRCFQADLPDLTSSSNSDGSLGNSNRYLGTRIWPVESQNKLIPRRKIGQGRPSLCQCESPGSRGCNQRHVTNKWHQLQSELGSVFQSWKFQEMGEEVSMSWTTKEQISFKNLVIRNPVSEGMSFLKPALKCFPFKSRENIMSYYFNVHVLRRLSRQTRLDSLSVDSDDEEDNETISFLKIRLNA